MRKLLLMLCLFCCFVSFTVSCQAAAPKNLQEEYNHSYFISIAAASCAGIYRPENAAEFSYLRDYGWEIMPYRESKGKISTNFSLAHNYFSDIGKNIYMVTFRGSADNSDWRVNLKTRQVPYEDQVIPARAKENLPSDTPAVHEGFISYTDTMLQASVLDENGLFKGIFKEVYENPDAYLILTGHSLGGAAATLLGERLVSLGMPKDKFVVITFGAPAVGNAAFAEKYGDRIDLIRITNTADPVPGSLQTVFGGYKQFGYNYKYHLSMKMSNFQHDIAMYFDHSVSEYFKTFDKAAAAGLVQPLPDTKITEGVPLVALWITSAPGISKKKYVPDMKRLLIDSYKMMLPSYAVLEQSLSDDSKYSYNDILRISRAAGAEYIIICGVDGNMPPNKDYWYITLNQSLFTGDGRLLNMSSFAKKVDPASGNIQAAGESIMLARAELQQQLPFIVTEYKMTLSAFGGKDNGTE